MRNSDQNIGEYNHNEERIYNALGMSKERFDQLQVILNEAGEEQVKQAEERGEDGLATSRIVEALEEQLTPRELAFLAFTFHQDAARMHQQISFAGAFGAFAPGADE